ADPFILRASDGRYYLYSTGGFRGWSSSDLVHWEFEGPVKTEHTWGVRDFWAPEVVEYRGRFYLYYTATWSAGGKRIGVALSDSPTGPFVDVYPRPLFDFGHDAIDPHVFIDSDGRKYLYYSKAVATPQADGRHESHIYAVELGDDLVSLRGTPRPLTRPEQPWERASGRRWLWNEAPAVFKHGGVYYLLYSANCYCDRLYAVGYATAPSPLGPFSKHPDNPLLRAAAWGGRLSGPGHVSLVRSPDGSEWFIAYHTHMDPGRGGGRRQLAIDRIGFRPDGSLYADGPTLTPQPLPAGSGDLVNLAPEATVTVSSTAAGHTASALTDGEFGIEPRAAIHDWVSDGEPDGPWVQLAWEQPRHLRYLLVYRSAEPRRQPTAAAVRFSDGSEARVLFPPEPGAAAVIPAPVDAVRWVRLVLEGLADPAGMAGLAEVMALGYPRGHLRIAAPTEGEPLPAATPVRIVAPGVSLAAVTIELDGQPLYRGREAPRELMLRAAALAVGEHRLVASAVAADGTRLSDTVAFPVKHVELLPDFAWGEVVQGDVHLRLQSRLAPGELRAASVRLRPIEEASGGKPVVLYEGSAPPEQIVWDTLAVADGAYDLALRVETAAGVRSERVYRVVVDNWEVLEDPILPPSESAWFGRLDRMEAVDRSGGWEHATGEAERYGGDGDRLRRSGSGPASLTWEMPALSRFAFTLYAHSPAAAAGAVLSLSADGRTWTTVSAERAVQPGGADGAWWRLELTGTVDPATGARFIRLTFNDDAPPGALELGHVRLVGRAGRSERSEGIGSTDRR
ncbi:MAG TPA: glycoside hydrolase family 43 protein, partial [Limnochordia bacterium]